MGDRRIAVTPRVDRATYFKFKALCLSHGVPVERGVEQAMRDTLERAGVAVPEVVQEEGNVSNT